MQSQQVVENESMAEDIVLEKRSNYTILIVDDDPVYRHMLSSFLHQQGYQVAQAVNGIDGLKKLRDFVPDLILCDLSMPFMEGVDFVEEVSWQFPNLPLIVVSATENMSDVAKVLRFGIKDFLTKPITQYQHLLAAIETSIEESNQKPTAKRDFSSQWFGIDECQVAEEKELYWHIEQLKQDPATARDLLHALQPDKKTSQGDWMINYLSLQSSETMPLIFDYAWIANGRFVFYLLDSASNPEDGIGSALLARALFNDFLRHETHQYADVTQLAQLFDQGIRCCSCAGPVNGMLGVADMAEQSISFLSAGLSGQWQVQNQQHQISALNRFGDQCHHNPVVRHLHLSQGGELGVSGIGQRSFRLNFKVSTLN
ncbi:MAG: response regulator [Vibrio sp.]